MYVFLASIEFLGAIDISRHMKDVIYIADVIKRYLIEVGSQIVVQISTDNASVMRKVVSIVQEDWFHLYFEGCMTHALSLLFQD